MSYEAMAGDIAHFIRHLGLKDVALMGHSLLDFAAVKPS
jgi:pimeloyl-ACP methyl ester carboxylesterase